MKTFLITFCFLFLVGMVYTYQHSRAANFNQSLPGATPPGPPVFNRLNKTIENIDINNGDKGSNANVYKPNPAIVKPLPGTTPPKSVLTTPKPR